MTGVLSDLEFHKEEIVNLRLVESLRVGERKSDISFVDIETGVLGRLGEEGFVGRFICSLLGFAEPVAGGGFLVGAGGRLGLVASDTLPIWSRQLLPHGQRFNDATVDFFGRLVVGTLSIEPGASECENHLFVLEKDGTLNCIRRNVGLSNGIAVDPFSGDLFHEDTLKSSVHRVPLDKGTRCYGEPELLHRFPEETKPDGVILLESGELVIALWGDGSLVAVGMDGLEIDRRKVTPNFPTSVCISNAAGEMWMGSASEPRESKTTSQAPGGLWKALTKLRQVPGTSWDAVDIAQVRLADL